MIAGPTASGKSDFALHLCKKINGVIKFLVGFTLIKLSQNEIDLLRGKCIDALDDIFFPKHFIHQKSIPTTLNGKIDRSLLEKKCDQYDFV